MPVITLEIGKLEKEKKEELIKNVSQTTSNITGVDLQHIIVIIRENHPDNIGTGGKMLSKVFEERGR